MQTPQIGAGRRLRNKIDLASRRLVSSSIELWNHPNLAELYPEYLFRNHSVVRSSVPLMRAALDTARARFMDDPVAVQMADYLERHIPEEMSHDEWLLDDLEVLGLDRREVVKRMPSGVAASLVGSQYYWIFHFHPVAILGYIAVLEGTPPKVAFVEAIADRTGIPLEAFSNLLNHANIDPRHKKDFDEVLDELPLRSEHTALIGVSAFQTTHLLSRVLEEVLHSAPKASEQHVASASRDELRLS